MDAKSDGAKAKHTRKSRGKVTKKETLTSLDQVTGRLETVVLDALHEARQRIWAAIEREMLKVSVSQYPILVDQIHELLMKMVPHKDK